MRVSSRAGRRPVRQLLASSSVAALLIGLGGPAAFAQCAVNDVGASTGPVTNSAAINCINIQNSTVGGNVTNTGSGTITATGAAAPTQTGITIDNSTITGTVSNAGVITAANLGLATGGFGIVVINNALVKGGIANSGTIVGSYYGIEISSVAQFGGSAGGGIVNAGTVSGVSAISLMNVATFRGGIINSGTVDGIRRAIFVDSGSLFTGGISNGGTLSAPGGGLGVSGTPLAVVEISTFLGGIQNSGTISGATDGISVSYGSTFAGGISNSGTITATNSEGIIVESIAHFGTSSAGGGITNSGLISAGGTGINVNNQVSTFSGDIANTGTIAAAKRGIGLGFAPTANKFGVISSFRGNVSNSGAITAGGTGIAIIASTLTGGVSNSGTISAGDNGIWIGAHVMAAHGTTTASTVITISTFSGGISNSGTISATTGNGIWVGGKATATNSRTESLTIVTFTGGIRNSGTISAGGNGIWVGSNAYGGTAGIASITISTFSGGISNSGLISAKNGIYVGGGASGTKSSSTISTFAGGIANSGTIVAANNGILVAGTAVSIFSGGITNSGTIAAYSAILVDTVTTFQGGISNTGLLSARYSGIGISGVSTFAGGVSNDGTIAAGYSGIHLAGGAFSGGITNSGAITAAVSAAGIGIYKMSTVQGGITNSGMISAGAGIKIASTSLSSVSVSTFAGNITNSGTIIGSGAAGIEISAVVQFGTSSVGGISNSGVISGTPGYGISVSSATFLGGISNSGTITASNNGINLSVTSFYGGIVNANGGTISGYRAIEIDSGSLFAGGISNRGTLIGTGSTALRVSGISTFQGGIQNSGAISGPTGIVISNGSTFTGGISNSGTISATSGSGIAVESVVQFGTSSAGGGIVNSSAITAGASAILLRGVTTFAGGISNSGTISGTKGIRIGWASTFTIAGVSTFLGGITNSGLISASGNEGILIEYASIFSGGITNAGSGTISAATRGIAISNVTTFSGNISNAGNITAATGIFIDAGVGFAAGSAIVNTGTIVGTTSAIDASQATSPVIIDINGGAISGDMIGAGAASGDTVNFALGSGSFTYANTIAGMQAVNINSGTLYDGAAITAAGVMVNSGGTLAPGLPNTTGTLSITGNLTFNAGSGYQVMITNAGTNSSTSVTGAAIINGGTAEVKPLQFGHYNAMTYTLLTASGGVTVNTPFAGPDFVGPFAYTGSATLTYPTDQVDLVLGPGYVDFAVPPGAGQNQQDVVSGIDSYITSGGTLPPGFANLGNLSGPAYLNALTQLDGEDATGAQTSAFQLMTQFLDLMLDPTAGGGAGGGGEASGFADEEQQSLPPDVALAYARALHKPPPQQNFDQRWSAWGSAFGGSGTYDGNATVGSTNVTATDYGCAAGMDYHVTPDTVYGFALGGGGTNWNLTQNLGSGRSDSFEAGVYAKTHWGPAYMSGALAFANHWFTTNRIAVGDDLTANFQGQSYAARGEVGYRYGVPVTGYIIGVTPYAALQVQDFHTPSYSESDLTGGGFGLSYNAVSATDTRSELGARFDNLTMWNGMPVILRGRLAWAHDWVSNPSLGAVFETLPGSNFTVNGAAVPQNSALTTAAAELHLTANWTAVAKFDGEFAPTAQTYAGTGTLRYTW